jgi:hypothetical protein
MPGTVVRVHRTTTDRGWSVVMKDGETFTNLDDAGWLYTGIGDAWDGVFR